MNSNKKRLILSLFMMLIFVSYHISLFSFTHSHTLEGITFSHSHPFKSGNLQHQHSAAEISFINSFITSLQYDIDENHVDFNNYSNLTNLLSYDCIIDFIIQEYDSIALRAPPVYYS